MSSIVTCDFVIESKNANFAMTTIRKYLEPFFPNNQSSGSIIKTIKLNESIISVELPAELASFCRGLTPWESCPRVSPIVRCITSTKDTARMAIEVAKAIINPQLPYMGVKIDYIKVDPSHQHLFIIGDNLDEIDFDLSKKNDCDKDNLPQIDLKEIPIDIHKTDLDSWFLKNPEFF